MAKTSAIIEGLQIFSKYCVDGYNTQAEHDTFYHYATDTEIQKDDLEKLILLGWFQPDAELEDDDEFSADDYDSDNSWAIYT